MSELEEGGASFDELVEEAALDRVFPKAHDHWARLHANDTVRFRGRYKHVPGIGWRVWDGMTWTEGDRQVLREHFDAVEIAYQVLPTLPPEKRKEYLNYLVKAANTPFAENTLKAMSAMDAFHANAGAFDADLGNLVTPDGVVDCRSMVVLTHSSARLVMRATRGSWRKELEDGTRWSRFMREVHPDPAVYSFMQRLFGYIVFGNRDEHIFPILVGPGGNGKSVEIDTLVDAMGDYATTIATEVLLWTAHDRHPTERMALYGRRLVAASELPEGRRLNESLVKQLTGTATFKARKMRQDEIEFNRTWVPAIDTNHLPAIKGTEDAIWARAIIIPHEVSFRGTSREVKGLGTKLRAEPDAVISWCAAGWRNYCELGLGLAVPPKLREATMEYRATQDIMALWVQENQGSEGAKEITAQEALTSYREFSGENWLGRNKFYDKLREAGVFVGRGNGNAMVVRFR